ncbi:Spx/MgsR family RNA polymerase-binding regulatory protein [Thalassobacillus pellis]|uniref:Spx/MgsR family RNA polymerase-binding regulatory protein n=1 Tax=Thalassobacillus pellis TaxID=748008 RepID=UPI001961AED0|nr:Spx/MgsR family RNA polymerase-binding regulatory protein [Thalassobacillus pellis]MBM7552299.1 Spx/MgsR family transcriptional regulator [Thalassobacillus pellis]
MDQLKFFSYPSCTSCRRTKSWLKEQGVQFKERHLFKETPDKEELTQILSLTTEGIDEILATRSKEFKSLEVDINSLTLNEFIDLVMKKPKLLKRPILTDGKKLVVGYDVEGLHSITKHKPDWTFKIS